MADLKTELDAFYPQLTGSYSDPAWITALASSKLTATGTPSGSVFLRGDFSWSAPSVAGSALTGTSLASSIVSSSLTSFGASPTLVTPTIASFTNATHSHQNAAGGGTLDAASIASGTLDAARGGAGAVNGILNANGSGTVSAATSGTDYVVPAGNVATATALATPRAIYGNNFDGTAALTQVIASTYGGTGNGFAKLSGPATTEKTFTLPNASATILTDNTAVTIAQGGTGTGSTLTGLVRGSATSMTAAELSGDVTTSGSNAVTVTKINGTSLAGLATGILKNTTATGVPSIATAGTDYVTPAGNVATATALATPRAIYGNNFDGTAALTQVIASTYGGTGNGFTKFSGPATTEKTFTLPNASATVLTDNAVVTIGQGGTGTGSTLTGLVRGSGTAMTAAELSGDVTTSGSNSVTVTKINGTSLAGLATGILKNTTTTGVPSIASAGTDYVTPAGNVATATALQTARTINGTSFDGTANITVTAAAGTLTGATLASGVTASSLTSFGAAPTMKYLLVNDSTPTTGDTRLIARNGPGQSSFPFEVQDQFGVSVAEITSSGLIVGSQFGTNANTFQLGNYINNIDLAFGSAKLISWDSGTTIGNNPDVGLARNAAGVVEVNSGTAGTLRDLKFRTITAGAWNGTKIGLAYGGTNADLSATGGSSQVLKQTTSGAAITVGQLAASDLSNGVTGTGAVVLADSPAFTTTPTAPTAATGTNTTQIATTAFVTAAVPNSSYRTILYACGSHIAGKVAGTYAIGSGDPLAVSGTGTLYPINTIYIASADYPSVNGFAPKLRIRAQLYTNDVAPTGNFTFGLYPITRPGTSGGTGVCIYTLGTVVSGSNGASFTTPAADGLLNAVGSDFSLPSDGHYVIGVVTTATIATNALVQVTASLQIHNA